MTSLSPKDYLKRNTCTIIGKVCVGGENEMDEENGMGVSDEKDDKEVLTL